MVAERRLARRRLLKAAGIATLTLLTIRNPTAGASAASLAEDRSQAAEDDAITLLLCGDVMTGRGIDQVLPHPADPRLYEPYVSSAAHER